MEQAETERMKAMASKTSFEQKGRPLRQRWARVTKPAQAPAIGCAALKAAMLYAGNGRKAKSAR